MQNLLPLLALLACPIGMGLMMFFMAKGSRKTDNSPAPVRSAADLRDEQRRLDAEIARLETSNGSRSLVDAR
ncbi:MAG: DUF2933 domain-containing protein [Solirubrobacteraceae bacterium]